MNIWDELILLLIAACAIFACFRMHRDAKKGCTGCCAACLRQCRRKGSVRHE
ncbi:MAG: FeoB-associated Cys-rich membrane protein [Clostridia bacterium]|nr:FeoB-associated Cys-rich membrane protein [Clostridia bacterium]